MFDVSASALMRLVGYNNADLFLLSFLYIMVTLQSAFLALLKAALVVGPTLKPTMSLAVHHGISPVPHFLALELTTLAEVNMVWTVPDF